MSRQILPETQQGEEGAMSQQVNLIMNRLSTFTEKTVKALGKEPEVANRAIVIVLLSLGSAMMVLALAFKVELFGRSISNLSQSEFIVVVLTGAMLVTLCASMHFYQYKARQYLRRKLQQTAERELWRLR